MAPKTAQKPVDTVAELQKMRNALEQLPAQTKWNDPRDYAVVKPDWTEAIKRFQIAYNSGVKTDVFKGPALSVNGVLGSAGSNAPTRRAIKEVNEILIAQNYLNPKTSGINNPDLPDQRSDSLVYATVVAFQHFVNRKIEEAAATDKTAPEGPGLAPVGAPPQSGVPPLSLIPVPAVASGAPGSAATKASESATALQHIYALLDTIPKLAGWTSTVPTNLLKNENTKAIRALQAAYNQGIQIGLFKGHTVPENGKLDPEGSPTRKAIHNLQTLLIDTNDLDGHPYLDPRLIGVGVIPKPLWGSGTYATILAFQKFTQDHLREASESAAVVPARPDSALGPNPHPTGAVPVVVQPPPVIAPSPAQQAAARDHAETAHNELRDALAYLTPERRQLATREWKSDLDAMDAAVKNADTLYKRARYIDTRGIEKRGKTQKASPEQVTRAYKDAEDVAAEAIGKIKVVADQLKSLENFPPEQQQARSVLGDVSRLLRVRIPLSEIETKIDDRGPLGDAHADLQTRVDALNARLKPAEADWTKKKNLAAARSVFTSVLPEIQKLATDSRDFEDRIGALHSFDKDTAALLKDVDYLLPLLRQLFPGSTQAQKKAGEFKARRDSLVQTLQDPAYTPSQKQMPSRNMEALRNSIESELKQRMRKAIDDVDELSKGTAEFGTGLRTLIERVKSEGEQTVLNAWFEQMVKDISDANRLTAQTGLDRYKKIMDLVGTARASHDLIVQNLQRLTSRTPEEAAPTPEFPVPMTDVPVVPFRISVAPKQSQSSRGDPLFLDVSVSCGPRGEAHAHVDEVFRLPDTLVRYTLLRNRGGYGNTFIVLSEDARTELLARPNIQNIARLEATTPESEGLGEVGQVKVYLNKDGKIVDARTDAFDSGGNLRSGIKVQVVTGYKVVTDRTGKTSYVLGGMEAKYASCLQAFRFGPDVLQNNFVSTKGETLVFRFRPASSVTIDDKDRLLITGFDIVVGEDTVPRPKPPPVPPK